MQRAPLQRAGGARALRSRPRGPPTSPSPSRRLCWSLRGAGGALCTCSGALACLRHRLRGLRRVQQRGAQRERGRGLAPGERRRNLPPAETEASSPGRGRAKAAAALIRIPPPRPPASAAARLAAARGARELGRRAAASSSSSSSSSSTAAEAPLPARPPARLPLRRLLKSPSGAGRRRAGLPCRRRGSAQ